MNQLNNVQCFELQLMTPCISIHCAHTLLAGGYHGLGPGFHSLIDFGFGNLAGQFIVDHFQITAATAAQTVLTVVSHLDQFNARNGTDNFPGGIIFLTAAPQITGIMERDGKIKLFERQLTGFDQLSEILRHVVNFKVMGIVFAPHLKT